MLVAAHGDVDEYCRAHGMIVAERYEGAVEKYAGDYLVLVTDNCESMNDYYYLKYKLHQRGIELVSTHWHERSLDEFVQYMGERENRDRETARPGRLPFGYRRSKGEVLEDAAKMVVVRRIFELRDDGKTYREIQRDLGVKHPDGRPMSISTIQVILQNRWKYD